MSKINLNYPVAKYELCKELYQLTKWEGTIASWYSNSDPAASPDLKRFLHYTDESALRATLGVAAYTSKIPAYDEGFLMRKLKEYRNVKFRIYKFGPHSDRSYMYSAQIRFYLDNARDILQIDSTTPENASCELLVNLKFGDIPGESFKP